MADQHLQNRIDAVLSTVQAPLFQPKLRAERKPMPLFSAFVESHLIAAWDLANQFAKVADTEGLPASVSLIEARTREQTLVGLVQYAVMLFMTHHPEARNRLKLKPLEVRQPFLVLSTTARSGPGSFGGRVPPTGGASPVSENLVNYWREDPLLNEHHEHWHLVYPTAPATFPDPKPASGYKLGDRHGELFAYMHEQMLARYNAERLCAGLSQVSPFAPYPYSLPGFQASIPEGYDPGSTRLWDGAQWYTFRARPAGAHIDDLTLNESPPPEVNWTKRVGALLQKQVDFCNAVHHAAARAQYAPGYPPLDIDNLGNTVEANANAVDFVAKDDPGNHQTYGNVHNDGHIHFMLFDNTAPYGVMASPAAAIRDPIFFRWHKLVDDIYDAYRKQLPAHDFTNAPQVLIRKQTQKTEALSIDIILCLESGLPAVINAKKFGSREYERSLVATFANWSQDYSKGKFPVPGSGESVVTTDTLYTRMRRRKINLVDAGGSPTPAEVEYLSPDEDFYYFFRVENRLERPQKIAVRVFLCLEELLDEHLSWIEMDRFVYVLKPRQRAVIFRPADQSSVVRKPALKPDDLTADDGASPAREAQPWCDCGWPYTLLLPRGTAEGKKCRLLVMLSDGNDISMPDHPECCTSISYCGLQDLTYPDQMPMGYPFDRPLVVRKQVDSSGNWAWRTITVQSLSAVSRKNQSGDSGGVDFIPS